MSKNRRKLLRKITVNDIDYFWSLTDRNCDGDGGIRFKIYKNKVKILEYLIYTEIITPKIVRKKILDFVADYE